MPRKPRTGPPDRSRKPDDEIIVEQDEDAPIRFGEEIERRPEVLEEAWALHEYREMVSRYHAEFLTLAVKAGHCAPPDAYPPTEKILDERGFSRLRLQYDFALTINLLDDDELIKQKLDRFKEMVVQDVLQRKERLREDFGGYGPQAFREKTRNPETRRLVKNLEQLRKQLQDALAVYPYGPNLSAASALGWIEDTRDKNECENATKRAERAYHYAEILMEAAIKGEFEKALAKALRNH